MLDDGILEISEEFFMYIKWKLLRYTWVFNECLTEK